MTPEDPPPSSLSPTESKPPVALEGPLAFQGARAYEIDTELEIETWWRVNTITDRPFSIMGHLLSADGATLAVDDGLGVAPVVLEQGDIIIQTHRFDAPGGDEAWLLTGAYWLDSMARWPVAETPEADGIVTRLEINR